MEPVTSAYLDSLSYGVIDEGNKRFKENDAVFLFDDTGKIISGGETARQIYASRDESTSSKELYLLDLEWIKANKITAGQDVLPCIDEKSLMMDKAFAEIFVFLQRYGMTSSIYVAHDIPGATNESFHQALKKVPKKNSDVQILIFRDMDNVFPDTKRQENRDIQDDTPSSPIRYLPSHLDLQILETISSDRPEPQIPVQLKEQDILFNAFCRLMDGYSQLSIGDGALESDDPRKRTMNDGVLVALIKENTSLLSFYKEDENGDWKETNTTTYPELSKININKSLEMLLLNYVEEEKWRSGPSHGKETVLKDLRESSFTKNEVVLIPEAVIHKWEMRVESRDVSQAFAKISAEFITIIKTHRPELSCTDVVVNQDFRCLDSLDIPGVRVHICDNKSPGVVTDKDPLKINLEVNKDFGYRYNVDVQVVNLQINQAMNEDILQNLRLQKRDEMWSESPMIYVEDNRPNLRFHKNLKMKKLVSVKFELLDTCGMEDKIFFVYKWDTFRWKGFKLSPKGNEVKFNTTLDGSFCIMSTGIKTTVQLKPLSDFTFRGNDERCSLYFPRGCISKKKTIECEIINVRREIMKRSGNSTVLSITKGIHVSQKGDESFEKDVVVQLPFVTFIEETQGDGSTDGQSSTEIVLFEVLNRDEVKFLPKSKSIYEVQNDCIEFSTNHFSLKGAAKIRTGERRSAALEIRKSYNRKSGYRFYTLVRENKQYMDVWFAIFNTRRYDNLRDQFFKEKKIQRFREITVSDSEEVFLRDGWILRFFFCKGGTVVTDEYYEMKTSSDFNRKFIKVRATNISSKFMECRISKATAMKKHTKVLVIPIDITEALPTGISKREVGKGIKESRSFGTSLPRSQLANATTKQCKDQEVDVTSEQCPSVDIERAQCPSVKVIDAGCQSVDLAVSDMTRWLNEKILLDLASRLEKKDVWKLGIQLDFDYASVTRFLDDHHDDLHRAGFILLDTWAKRTASETEDMQVSQLKEALKIIKRNDIEQALSEGFSTKRSSLHFT